MGSPKAGLKKSNILHGYRKFSHVIAEGKSLQRSAVRCFFVVEPQAKRLVRVGFAVNRGVRTAVERNRGRRWLREAYRQNKNILLSTPEWYPRAVSVVFLLRMRGEAARGKEFKKSVDQSMIFLLKEMRDQLGEYQ
ncbi:MAG TPA: ribonuclease P protein component [Methylomirabilota bacterium]|nr:ribonuclease P protein component [Methylomirabilota bacterium]